MSSLAENRERGLRVEDAACERWPLAPVGDRTDWYDLEFIEDFTFDLLESPIAATGTKVEAKSCYERYERHDGGDHRPGRWWIQRGSHERLVEDDGEYVLAVVERESDELLRMALLKARWVDSLIGSWWDAGNGGRTAEEFHQIPWTRVFVDGGGSR